MNKNIKKYKCTIKLVKYPDNTSEYEGYINLLPNIVGSGKTYKECFKTLYSNLDAYLDYVNNIK